MNKKIQILVTMFESSYIAISFFTSVMAFGDQDIFIKYVKIFKELEKVLKNTLHE